MIHRNDVIEKALELGFEDIGFTTAEPFPSQAEILKTRRKSYKPIMEKGLDLLSGTNPATILENARSIIVLVENYFREGFPPSLVGKFGRCYLDDDRMTKDSLVPRIRLFRDFLRKDKIESKVPFAIPHRLTAARAGSGTLGKNNFFYARSVARKSSWVLPVAVVVDREFPPDEPSVTIGCPDWCKNACIAACPTGALKSPNTLDPRLCISYLTYYGKGLTPRSMREQMGMWVYGCDRCQEVCPRNASWLSQELPPNERVLKKEDDFMLERLLRMDETVFQSRVWPHMFYMPPDDLWRWKMNAARAMGNSLDSRYIPELAAAVSENGDDRVRCMAVWAMGRIGGKEAKGTLDTLLPRVSGDVKEEVLLALERCQ
jgi:epoxyqueuosine reductase